MKEFSGRVAVVTGAASGIGRALADRCAAEGMKVVLADVEVEQLERAAAELRGSGAQVLAVRTDVSDAAQVEELAERTARTFGGPHLLFNNAGVSPPGAHAWEYTLADWRWVLGVNLWGVIHGVRAFVPRMLRSEEEGWVVNTASITGLLSSPFSATYATSKHAIVSLSESLLLDLQTAGARVGVSVLCSAWVQSRISDSARNRPPELQDVDPGRPQGPEAEAIARYERRAVAAGTPPEEIANDVFDGIREERFYMLPHEEWKPLITRRASDIVNAVTPTMGLPPLELLEELAKIKGTSSRRRPRRGAP